jgi:hypothetical protein
MMPITHSFAKDANEWGSGQVDSTAVKSGEFRVRYLKDDRLGPSGIRATPGTLVVAGMTGTTIVKSPSHSHREVTAPGSGDIILNTCLEGVDDDRITGNIPRAEEMESGACSN